MTNIEYLIEKSILATVLFSNHQKEHESFFENFELKEEYFQDHFHRLVAKQINHNRSIGLSTQDEYIVDAMDKTGTLTNQMIEILSANVFSKHLFEVYYRQLTKPKLSQHWDI